MIGVKLDRAGWVSVESLLTQLKFAGRSLGHEQLKTVVAENDKQRFEFSQDGRSIRARQGHSIEVELGYAQATPPEYLYHGTPEKSVASIRQLGLKKMSRHHVHLHQDPELASTVGQRRGKPVVLLIEAGSMADAGYGYFRTPNGVWLTDHVPPDFIRFPDS